MVQDYGLICNVLGVGVVDKLLKNVEAEKKLPVKYETQIAQNGVVLIQVRD